jgi:hypothetical protein
MATPSNKPRDIKDLKARLGRTMTPGQAGGSMPPVGPGSLPAPSVGGSLPPPAVRGPATPAGAPFPGAPGSVPAPAFSQPARPASQQPSPSRRPGPLPGVPGFSAPAPAPAARPAAGPFEVGAPVQAVEKKVRLVIDDSAVKEDEIGRKSTTRNVVLIVIGLVLGLGAGFGVGSTGAERNQFKMAVHDGKDIYARISEVSKSLDEAKGYLKTAVDASQGGPGKQAHIDYKAIEQLRAIKKPFSAGEFSRRRYLAFPTAVVDDLFEYYNNINILWAKFESLGTKTTGDRAREALNKSAQSADALMSADYGVVLAKSGDAFIGGLVVVRPKPADAAAAEPKEAKGKGKDKEKDDAPIMLVSSRDGGREVERKLFTGQADFSEKSDAYVMLVDKARSMGTLGTSANLFGQLRGDLVDAQGLINKTSEIQGRLITELQKVANLIKD